MKETQPRQNYLGVGGWIWAGKYTMERYLYLLHRVTGLGLILFVIGRSSGKKTSHLRIDGVFYHRSHIRTLRDDTLDRRARLTFGLNMHHLGP